MKTKVLIVLMAISVCLSSAFAYDVEQDGLYFNLHWTDNTAELTYGDIDLETYPNMWYTDEVVIPESVTYEGQLFTVTAIGRRAFNGCEMLSGVTMPTTITEIKDEAFQGCGLHSFVIPDHVKRIGYRSFSDCHQLQSITIGDGVEYIGESCIAYCSQLTDIVIGQNVKFIGKYAFSQDNISSIVVPGSVTYMDYGVFYECKSLTQCTLNEGLQLIGGYTFAFCTNLSSVNIPASVMTIGEGVFDNSYIYNNSANWNNGILMIDGCIVGANIHPNAIPDNTRLIADGLFFKAGNNNILDLTDFVLPESVEQVGKDVFMNATTTTDIANSHLFCRPNDAGEEFTVPEGIQTIAPSAFKNCKNTKTIILPASLKEISGSAFVGCTKLENIIVAEGNTVFTSENGVLFQNNGKELVKYPCGKQNKSYSVPLSVTRICDYAFMGCDSLKQLVITENVEKVDPFSLIPVRYGPWSGKLSDPITYIDFELVWNTDKVADYPPYGLINAYATKLTFGDNVTHIPAFMCYGWPLKHVTIGNNVKSIGEWAFSNTTLEEIVIPDNVIELGYSVFWACTNLSSATIGNGIRTLPWGLFYGNYGLSSITLSEGLTCINDEAFGSATFTELTIPSTVTRICPRAFLWCSNVHTIRFMAPAVVDIVASAVEEMPTSATLYVRNYLVEEFREHPVWGLFNIVGEDVATNTVLLHKSEAQGNKLLRNGELLILRNGKTYTVQGREVK